MNYKQINRAIAEQLGAVCTDGSDYATWPHEAYAMLRSITVHVARSDENDDRWFAAIPSFATDLNALKLAIDNLRSLPGPQWHDFVTAAKDHFGSIGNCIVPDPKELAIVYLKALGKWKV